MKTATALMTILLALGGTAANADDMSYGEDKARGDDSVSSIDFDTVDSNRDGSLDKAEAGQNGISDNQFQEMDENSDDVITRTEYLATVRKTPSESSGS